MENTILPYDWVDNNSIIKVIGVGGGGCNAVDYMFNQKVTGCTFVACNTDAQVLSKCSVPIKIQLGEGLGAGADPTKGRNAAIEAESKIAEILDNNTKMVFVTTGMGGGTGTGASPVIANMAKTRGILTVGVVTIPFKYEGPEKFARAMDGINELEKNVDSLLIINNDNLYKYFGELLMHETLPKADEVLSTAVRGITDIINKPGYINVDFADVRAMMKNSGIALMGCGTGSGENRIEDAVKGALESPLLNDHDLKTAKNVLVNITVGRNDKGVSANEWKEMNDMIAEYTGNANNFKSGLVMEEDPEWGDKIQITAIATGFKVFPVPVDPKNIITIDRDFTYTPETMGNEIELSDNAGNIKKIGYNNSDNIRKFHFDEKNKPVLVVSPGQNIGELEQIPSIRRVTKRKNAE